MSTSITMVLGYIGCLVVFYLLGLLSKKKNANNTYDERQEIVRGRAYKYGFFALLAGQTMEVILDITETIVISRE